LSRSGHFRELWKLALCSALNTREFERLVQKSIFPFRPPVGNRRKGRGRRPAAASETRHRTGSES
jgi:hypothetical protein